MKWFPIFCLIVLIQINLNSCFIEIGYLGYTVIAAAGAYFYKNRCDYFECCTVQDESTLYYEIRDRFRNQMFGQPILSEILPAAIHAHVNKRSPHNPLIISMHGWTGSGKTYASQIVAEAMFEHGLRSIFVKKITPAQMFPNPAWQMSHYKSLLVNFLEDQANLCRKSLVIIEEIDKLHPELLDTLSSYLNNYHPNINHMTFIFTSNVGSDKIVEKAFEFYKNGADRDKLQLHDFESVIKNQAYNDESAMKYSTMISSHIINHYIPFLPLERSHVEQCIDWYFKKATHGSVSTSHLPRIKENVFRSIEWWPADLQLYSNSGCKQVANKLDIAIRILS